MRTKLKITLLMFTVATVILFLLNSCATRKMIQRTPVPGEISKKSTGIQIELRFLPEEEKEKRYGKVNNPFISPVSALRTELLVFECSIKTGDITQAERYKLILNKIELQFGKTTTNPLNSFHLLNFWEPRLKQKTYSRWNMKVLKKVIKANLLQNELLIKGEESIHGLIIFEGRFPDYGAAVLYIPVYNSRGQEIKRFRFEFNF